MDPAKCDHGGADYKTYLFSEVSANFPIVIRGEVVEENGILPLNRPCYCRVGCSVCGLMGSWIQSEGDSTVSHQTLQKAISDFYRVAVEYRVSLERQPLTQTQSTTVKPSDE